jgi:hypothetical protein
MTGAGVAGSRGLLMAANFPMPEPNHDMWLAPRREGPGLKFLFAAQKIKDNQNQRDNQKDVNEAADCRQCEESEQPEDQDDDSDVKKHVCSFWL